MTRQKLRIGEMASLIGVTAKTIRHYHEIGLLAEPERSEAGYRLYEARHLTRLIRIKHLKDLGLPLRQIQGIFEADDPDEALLSSLEQLHRDMMDEITRLREHLDVLERHLEAQTTLDEIVQPDDGGDIYPYFLERLYPTLGEVAPAMKEMDQAFMAQLEAFAWPLTQRKMMEEAVDTFADNAVLQEFGRLIIEQFEAMADVPEDSPLVVNAAWTVVQSESGRKAREWMSAQAPDTDTYQQIFEETADAIAADLYSPAQYRFLNVLKEMLAR